MYKWQFEHTAGNYRQRLTLEGYTAPFGRPRQSPVITEKLKARTQAIYYPGSNKAPTRNAFGTQWEDVELKGRWMAKTLPNDDLGYMIERWTNFFQAQMPIRMSWGPIASWTGFMTELEIARESEDEVAWKMTFMIDERAGVERSRTISGGLGLPDGLEDVDRFLTTSIPVGGYAGAFKFIDASFLEQLDFFASLCNGPIASLNQLAGELDNFEKATFSTIAHFRSAATGLQTAIVSLRETLLNVAVDSIIVVRNAKNDIEWLTYQTRFDTDSSAALDTLAFLSHKAALAGKAEGRVSVVAVTGDTWESLAARTVLGIDGASRIRALNGIHGGTQPTPGKEYVLP